MMRILESPAERRARLAGGCLFLLTPFFFLLLMCGNAEWNQTLAPVASMAPIVCSRDIMLAPFEIFVFLVLITPLVLVGAWLLVTRVSTTLLVWCCLALFPAVLPFFLWNFVPGAEAFGLVLCIPMLCALGLVGYARLQRRLSASTPHGQ